MAIPDERKVALSIPTQTAMKGLRDGLRNSLCRSAMRAATFSKLISQVFEISGFCRGKNRHPGVTAPPLSLEVRAIFGSPRRMIVWPVLRGAQERAPQDDGGLPGAD
jgi:hypothetical protein